jgi:hypothetical protein
LTPPAGPDHHLGVIKKLLWFAGMMVALTLLANVACGPKEKFCVDDPGASYHCRPAQEDAQGFGGDGGGDPCDGAGTVIMNGMAVCNF